MKVSVVIPCYNVERYIDRCLHSVAAQSHPDLEVICVDDGSTDGTADRIELSANGQGWPIRLVRQTNKGAPAARNVGLAAASGTYVQFLDADDVIGPEKIAHQVALAERYGSPGLIVGSSTTFSHGGDVLYRSVQKAGESDPWMALTAHGLNVTSAILWGRDAVMQAGGWDEQMGSSQEYDLMFRMLAQGTRIVQDDVVLTEIHKRDQGSISQTGGPSNWRRYVELRARIIAHVKTHFPERDLHPYYQVLFDGVRTLFAFDPATAITLYERHLPADFVPGPSSATGRGYLLLHRLFGFERANRLRRLLR